MCNRLIYEKRISIDVHLLERKEKKRTVNYICCQWSVCVCVCD